MCRTGVTTPKSPATLLIRAWIAECVWRSCSPLKLRPCCQVIAELDEKKREALEKTWRKVNQDFGSIFSMLLPGTSAKLEPPEDCTFLDGRKPLFARWKALPLRLLHDAAASVGPM